MLLDYLFLALENLKHRGLRSWLTMLGIFIGIAAVVSLISLGNGLETSITAQFDALSTDTLIVSNAETGFGPPGSTAVESLTEHDVRVLERVQGINIVVPRLIRVVKVEYNSILQFRYAGSIPENEDKLDFIYDSLNVGLDSGRLLKAGERGKIVVGNDFKTNNGFEKDIRVGSKLLIQGKSFEIIGIMKKASTFTINSVVMMSEEDMKDILSIGNEIDTIVVQVMDEGQTEEIAESIRQEMRRDRNLKVGEEDFSVKTPSQALSSVKTIIMVINIVITGIATLSLLIGAIGIANTMFTSVLERTKEIVIMKAVGAKNSDILKLFLLESGLLGLVGGLIGAAIGLSMAFLVSFSANQFFGNNIFIVSPSLPLLIGAISLSFFLGIFSGVVPAYQASKLEPVEALRK